MLPTKTKEQDGPFPWQISKTAPKVLNIDPTREVPTPSRKRTRSTSDPGLPDQERLPNELLLQPGFQNMIAEAASTGCISFDLPKRNSVAGAVLHHCTNVMETLLKTHSPMIFKVGFTHNCCWRWSNKLYGYNRSVDKWSRMVVMYISEEPFSPAMLEAALIDKYSCNMAYIYESLFIYFT